jgi:sugar lactone lactonase YvrE
MQAEYPRQPTRRRFIASLGAAMFGTFLRVPAALAADAAAEPAALPEHAAAKLETVATFGDEFRLVGIGVTRDGRVFATAPASEKRSRYSVVEVDLRTGTLLPFPDSDWNHYKPGKSGERQWISAQALWVDERGRLWVLDSSLPTVDQRKQPPRLVEFDLETRQLERSYTFGQAVTPKDALNDVRIDLTHGYAFMSNAGNQGGILVTHLSNGQSRLVLAGDRSSVADPHEHLMLGDREARKPDGSVLVLQTDGIALSPQRNWLYYRSLTDHHYWRVPTAALIDETLAPAALSQRVQDLGEHALTGGLLMGDDGTLYGGDLEHHTVVALKVAEHGGKATLAQRILVNAPQQVSWADGFALQNDYLYFADSHLPERDVSNGYARKGRSTIFRVKLPPQPPGTFPG